MKKLTSVKTLRPLNLPKLNTTVVTGRSPLINTRKQVKSWRDGSGVTKLLSIHVFIVTLFRGIP